MKDVKNSLLFALLVALCAAFGLCAETLTPMQKEQLGMFKKELLELKKLFFEPPVSEEKKPIADLFSAFGFSDSESEDDSDSDDEDISSEGESDVPEQFTLSRKASIRINGKERRSVSIANPSLRGLTLMRADSFNTADQRIIFRVLLAMNERGSKEIQILLRRLTIRDDEELFQLLQILEGTRKFVFDARDEWELVNPVMQESLKATGIKSFISSRRRGRGPAMSTLFDQLKDFLLSVRGNAKFVTEFIAKVMESDESDNAVMARENVIKNAVDGVIKTLLPELKKAILKKVSLRQLQAYLNAYLTMVAEEEIQALYFNDLMSLINDNYLDDGTRIDPSTPRGERSPRSLGSIFNQPAVEVEESSTDDD